MNLFIDIETVPTENETVIQRIADKVSAPGNYKKQESIDKWMAENGEAEKLAGVAKTGLSGTFGQILCIGWAIDDEPVTVIGRDLDGSEASVLEAFYLQLVEKLGRRPERQLVWIGHNVLKFDLRFIKQRTIVNQVNRRGIDVPADMPAHSDRIFDTMYQWAGYGGTVSLDDLCLALDIDTPKNGMSGKDVWAYAKEGRYQEIEDYCMKDVEAVRSIYNKMTFKGVSS